MAGDTELRTHRFALAICGGVSLGAYEAGVVSQLYRDISNFNLDTRIAGKAHVSIDAISGASAGSITGLILAQAVGLGLPPDALEGRMRTAWIELLDIERLLELTDSGGQARSIYSDNVIDEIIKQTLTLPDIVETANPEPIALWLTMTNLDGIPYAVDFTRDDHAQPGDTVLFALDYQDYVPFLISGQKIEMVSPRMLPESSELSDTAGWSIAARAARASSSFPIAFPPSLQRRDLTQYPEYLQFIDVVSGLGGSDTVAALPNTGAFQFTDGGLFSNQPIGRCIDAVAMLNKRWPERDPNSAQSAGMAGRSFIIIDPVPQTPKMVEEALNNAVSDEISASLPPAILGKILAAYFSTAIYADFKTAEEMNETLRNVNSTLSKLDDLGLPPETAAQLKNEFLAAAGLDDKREITLQRIPGSVGPNRRLAGEFSGHFGGFFRRDYREADFITGQNEARTWFNDWLMLWLSNHASDLDMTSDAITPDFVGGLLPEPPQDPMEFPIPPTELTPFQMGAADWFPHVADDHTVSYIDRLAALNTMRRSQIVTLAEKRLIVLLENWFHVPPLLARPESFLVNHFLGPKFIDEPPQ